MEELSAVLSAVKPKKRTDQYKLLAALYCGGAVEKAIATTELHDQLSLQLGKGTPKNITGSLRKYSGYVQVAEKGPPLRWRLTPKGLTKLRALSGLPLSHEVAESGFLTDVGIVCALEDPEFTAVTDAVGGDAAWKPTGSAKFPHVYRTCFIETAAAKRLTVVAATATSMGLTAASILTTQMIMQFRPRLIVMIGIAAGTRQSNKEFGDVLVADPSVDYNSGKVVRADGIRGFLPDPYPLGLNARLRSVLQKYVGKPAIFQEIRDGWPGEVPKHSNRIHIGPLGAADQVIDDASRVIEIQKNWRKLIGVEMETYGVYRACHEAPEPKPRYVSFKSVCDFAAEKSDSWQEYAAYVAAQFAVGFLKAEWEGLWPSN